MLRATMILALALFASASMAEGDPAAGKEKSGACVACHGPNGISPNPEWPNLAGQQETYLINQIKAFRDGARENQMMSPMVQGLSDQDVADLAAYYHGLPAGGE